MNCNNHFLPEGSLHFLRVKDIYDLLRKQLKDWTQVRCEVCGKMYMKHKFHIAKEQEERFAEQQQRAMRAFDAGI